MAQRKVCLVLTAWQALEEIDVFSIFAVLRNPEVKQLVEDLAIGCSI